MTKKHLRMISKWTGLVVIALTAASVASAAPGRPRTPRQSEKPRGKSAKVERIETLKKQEKEARILQNLGVSRVEVTSCLKEFRNDPAEYEALKRLLNKSAESDGSRALSAYLRLMSQAPGKFHLTPRILEARVDSFAPATKANFAETLESAARIAANGKAATREEAFDRALKQSGRYENYRERCRK